jgi:hypothetical protein
MSNDTTTKKKELRPLEVGVGAGAAVITAFASSYLGTAGTLTGAALASVVGTVSTSVLRSSAGRSADRLRQTTARLRDTQIQRMPRPTDTRPVESESDIDPYGTQLFGAPDAAVLSGATPAEAAAATPDSTGGTPRRPVRPRWVVLGAGAAIAFAVALVLITGIESAAGKPLAGLVGKETGGGTTLGRATGGDSGSSGTTPSPTPSATPTGDPGSSATQSPTSSPTSAPSATSTAPVPAATTPVPSATQPAPTQAPGNSPLTSETP